jgi:hypothetical protein
MPRQDAKQTVQNVGVGELAVAAGFGKIGWCFVSWVRNFVVTQLESWYLLQHIRLRDRRLRSPKRTAAGTRQSTGADGSEWPKTQLSLLGCNLDLYELGFARM